MGNGVGDGVGKGLAWGCGWECGWGWGGDKNGDRKSIGMGWEGGHQTKVGSLQAGCSSDALGKGG